MFNILKITSLALFILFPTIGCEQPDDISDEEPENEDVNSEIINSIINFSLTPNDSITINKDFTSSVQSFLPELLGQNSLNAHYNNGSNEALNCLGHHYNSEINEHILHCTSPSNDADIYLGLSSSDTNVISFSYEYNDSYYMSYWNPIMSGTTQITGTLLFADNPPTFTTYITLTSAL